jgi:hypothetical protein
VRRLEWKVQAENDLFDILDSIGHDNPDAAVELVQKRQGRRLCNFFSVKTIRRFHGDAQVKRPC